MATLAVSGAPGLSIEKDEVVAWVFLTGHERPTVDTTAGAGTQRLPDIPRPLNAATAEPRAVAANLKQKFQQELDALEDCDQWNQEFGGSGRPPTANEP